MVTSPADDYIRIALAKAGGNKTLAKKALLAIAAKDAHVAQLLAAPFLDAICTQAIDRYMRVGQMEDFSVEPPVEEKAPEKGVIPPTEASGDHKDAVMKMVAAFRKKD